MCVFATRRAERPATTKPALLMENIIFGVIALALLVYLLVAVLRPEKF
jgi:K+-transporting ATPase KdpF subunit